MKMLTSPVMLFFGIQWIRYRLNLIYLFILFVIYKVCVRFHFRTCSNSVSKIFWCLCRWRRGIELRTYVHVHILFSYISAGSQPKYTFSNIIPDIGPGVRVFANGLGDLGSIPGRVIPKTQKMVLDASLLNTQHYKVRIKGKVEQLGKGLAPSPTHWCSSYRKGSFRVTLDYGRQLYFTYVNEDH